ncbi:hypothetical protein [Clostridium felsineum]|uniref:hypothetical protein n=1 Tax=Clostridium felsineum TaxID=36839 RepID=UPI00098C8AED|nr:hypothetical protein [Clostridium felsineum]URZ15790.1 hypothetical protein CLFE_018370 [Clostridium felsineum DSM 794]
MLEQLIKTGNEFNGKFTASYKYGSLMGIDKTKQNEYLKWLAKLGVYCESKLRTKYPEMTANILSMVKKQSIYEKDYEIIVGYLESAKELEN